MLVNKEHTMRVAKVLDSRACTKLVLLLQLHACSLKERFAQSSSCLQGILRVASLFDGTAWALVTPEHLYALAASQPMGNSGYHGALLDAYRGSHQSFAAVPDDGYIMQVIPKWLTCQSAGV